MTIQFIKFLTDKEDPGFEDKSRLAEFLLSDGKKTKKCIMGNLPVNEQEAIEKIMTLSEHLFDSGKNHSDDVPIYTGSIEKLKKSSPLKLDVSKITETKNLEELKSLLISASIEANSTADKKSKEV